MDFTATSLVFDFAYASILLIIAKIIRVKIPFIQRTYIPTPLLAGLLGIIGGKYCLNAIPFSGAAGGYSGILMTVLISTMFLGNKKEGHTFRSVMNEMGDTFLTNSVAYLSQWGIGLLSGFFLIKKIWPGLSEYFGLMMPSGFAGGHGTAAAFGAVFGAAGWADATSIATTFATIGMLVGTFGGMILINIAARKGWTAVVKKPSELPEEFKSGLIRGKRSSCGEETISPMSMDTFTFHFMLVMLTAILAYKTADLLKALTTISFPAFGIGMIMSFVVNLVLRQVGADKYVDKTIMTRTGGCLTDYLIVFGVSTINMTVVIDLWQPILVLSLLGLATVLFYVLIMCRKNCAEYWFEQGVIIFGWATGATPTSILLLRTCDPEYKTGVFQNWVVCWIFVSIIDVFNCSLTPHFTIQGYGVTTGWILLGSSIILYMILILRTRARKRAGAMNRLDNGNF